MWDNCDAIEYNTSNNIYTAKIDFEYNKDRQLTKIVETVGGYKTTSSITYKNGDAIETSEVSQKEGKETAHCKIYYTSDKVTSPIENKGCIYGLCRRIRFRLRRLSVYLLCWNVRKTYQAFANI